jgi:HAD superfamily hydrolase (TIGR01509 family)
MIKGVIFDMDGLMFDTERIWATLWKPALTTLGLPYKEGLDAAARGSAGDSMRAVLRRFYGPDCDTDAIMDALHAQAETAFQAPPPKKPGLDELIAYLEAQHIPMAVASSSRMASIRHHLDGWGLTHYFKVIVSGEQFSASKPDPEIFLRAAEALGTAPSRTLVLEDSYNGVRAGAAGHFVTVMVPDMAPANDEMRRLYTAECKDLHEVKQMLETGRL